ncbi:hypothetical protein COCNU_05G010520 [Cocos nucifera]|uniref:SANT domain-containing protein n=1 Tax=Cocos nucifera TaxID=13894 RepID=A0A8K0N259_COCNU|nr:hypothetical protein COCNU_05G010520 [Cocos nucifera]
MEIEQNEALVGGSRGKRKLRVIKEHSDFLLLPQITIATAIMFCHRFYLHQSHAKNEWQAIAAVCMFLASKVEETPRGLDKVVIVAYETLYRRDPAVAQKIHQKEVFGKQKALILLGERLLLSTIRFDFNIQHPYKPLLDALKKLGITHKDVRQVAWNFVNDWLRTTLCLQYKPHYIAAGSLFLAAKLHNIRLVSERGHVWWHEFDVAPQQLEEVIQRMTQLLGYKSRPMVTHALEKPIHTLLAAKKEVSKSPDSVLTMPDSCRSSSSHDFDREVGTHRPVGAIEADGECSCVDGRTELQCQMRESESPIGVSKDGETSGMDLDHARLAPHHVVNGLIEIDLELQCQPREPESLSSVAEDGETSGRDLDPISVAKDGERSGMELDQARMEPQHDVQGLGKIDMEFQCQRRESEGQSSVAKDGETSGRDLDESHHVVNWLGKTDIDRIKAKIKRRKMERGSNKCVVAVDDSSNDAWVEKDLEIGIDVDRIKAMMKRRKKEKESNKWTAAVDDFSEDAWIVKELETGIEFGAESAANKQRSIICSIGKYKKGFYCDLAVSGRVHDSRIYERRKAIMLTFIVWKLSNYNMFLDSDSIDDILLPTPVAAEQALGKFRPRLRAKTTKMTPVSSSISNSTQTIQLKDSVPDPKHQEHSSVPSFRIADSCTVASDNHVTQESVNQSKTTNSEDLISNVDNGEGLQQDQRNSGEDADVFFSMDSLDNLLQPTSTNARAVGRFKPKAMQPQDKKLATPSSAVLGVDKLVSVSNLKSSSSPLEAVPSKLHTTQEVVRLINESVVHNETSQCGAEISEKDKNLQSDLDKSEAEAGAEISGVDSLDDIVFLPDRTSDHPEASRCKDLHIGGKKEEASQHDQEGSVEIVDTFLSMESLDDSFQHGPTTVYPQDGSHALQSDGNFQVIPEKPAEEIMMMPFGMESLDDISFSPSAAAVVIMFILTVKQVGKFQPKLASRPKGGKAKSVSFALPNASETTAPSVETCSEGNSTRSDPPIEDLMSDGYLDNHQQSSSVNYDFSGDFQMDDGKLEEEDISESSGLASFNTLLSLPMSTTGKFQPKPSARTKYVKSNASAVQTGAMECVQCECDSLPPEAESLEGHASSFPADSFVDSALPMPSELARERAELFETCTLEAATLGGRKTTQTIEILSERDNHISGEREPTELLQDICVEAHSPNVEEHTQPIQEEKHNSETVEDIAASKPSRKLRKQIYMHSTGKPEGGMDEDQSDDEYRGEDVPKKKRVPKKSTRKMTERKKPGKKRKRTSGKPDSVSEELPKKRFPHGTRRKRRQVNKVLLETPEDEIDRTQLRIKDLIMLAEAKERISSKESAALGKSFPNQRYGNYDPLKVLKLTYGCYIASKPSRKLRKQIYMHSTGKPEGGMDEDQSDDEYRGEDVPKKKRVPKKSTRKMTERKKPGKKRKRTSGKPDSVSEELPKKRFPHGTRRKRRQVNKVLLETPEDEIDRTQLRIKDLIMLAEAKERISSKESAALGKSFPNQSTGSFPSRTYVDEDNLFGEEEEQNLDGEGSHNIQPNSTKLNYHSYMNRPQSVRWSKADTELFYQAIRQFGTDFAMIQQLFPNRTRHQVKLKFKNEERKHPLQVHDALVHRSKGEMVMVKDSGDHAHFERVIRKLQTQAEQSSHNEATGSQDAAGENEEEDANGWGSGVGSPADSDWKFEAPDQPEATECGSVYDRDASSSYPHDMEEDTFTEF